MLVVNALQVCIRLYRLLGLETGVQRKAVVVLLGLGRSPLQFLYFLMHSQLRLLLES